MIIDGHAHSSGEFWSGDGIVRVLDELEVDKVVLTPGPANEPTAVPLPDLSRYLRTAGLNYLGQILLRTFGRSVLKLFPLSNGNAYVASLARKFPERILQCHWVDPSDERMLAELDERYRAWRFKMLKVHQCLSVFESGSPGMHALARFAAERGMPFFVHSYLRPDIEGLARFMGGHPETTFIVAHLLGLEVYLEADPASLANVYFDISTPSLVPESHVVKAVEQFGAGRVLMGSDTPFGIHPLKKCIERVRGLNIPEEDKRLILGENLRRLLGL
jgi:predicted TIM-barrel fold metal-dependent hydrolase